MPRTPQQIVILTGAGVSAESGLGTFREEGGMWSKFDPYKLASPEGFAENPALVQEFYNLRRKNLLEAAPNAAHVALGRLQEGLALHDGLVTIVTQNIDDLHERGGACDVIHMHGELLKARCLGCGAIVEQREDITDASACAPCGAVGRLRPHVVWFGEIPLHLDDIAAALDTADLFVSIGTSGAVYPANGFVAHARARRVATLELNLEPSDGAALFDDARYGPASKVVPAWVEEILHA